MTTSPINERASAIFESKLADYTEQYDDEIFPNWMAKDKPFPEPLSPHGIEVMWEDAAVNYCESPIEQMMLAALIFASTGYGPWPMDIYFPDVPFTPPDGRIFLAPQFEFMNFRIDIAMFAKDFSGNEIRLAIECDGHNFHRTKKQMRHDRKRERTLQLHGWNVMRFTGSEIFEDAAACAEEAGEFFMEMFERDMERTGVMDPAHHIRRLAKLGYVSPFTPTTQDNAA